MTKKEITVAYETITPESAKYALGCQYRNRPIRRKHVERIKRDMRSGTYTETHHPIAFDEDGILVDGQHRLTAIIEVGITRRMLVARNVPRENLCVTEALPRSAQASISMYGHSEWVDNTVVAVARILIRNFNVGGQSAPTYTELDMYIKRNEELIKTACSMLSKSKIRGIRTAGVVACLVAALHCGIPEETVRKFMHVINTGEYDDQGDFAALRCRDFLITGFRIWEKQFVMKSSKKVQRAIAAFNDREPMVQLREPSGLFFDAPE